MKKQIELSILVILYILFGYFSIASAAGSSFLLTFNIVFFISIGALFFGNLLYLFPALLKKQSGKFLIWNGLLLVVTQVICGYSFAFYLADLTSSKIAVEVSHLIHPTVFKETFPFLFAVLLAGVAYAFIRHLIISQQFLLLKKIALTTATGIAAAGVVFFVSYQADVGYEGDESIRFIDKEYSSFDEIRKLPQFKNKAVYVDLWFSSCGPCIKEFQHLPIIKSQLKEQEVEYLYLARETSHPNSRQRWKNAIKKFNLQGWHIYMNSQLEQHTWRMILENQSDSSLAAYPRYLLIDKNGEFITYNAKRPSEGKAVIDEIKLSLQ